ESVLIFLVLLRAVLGQPPRPLLADKRPGLIGRGHAGRRQEPLEIGALTGLALWRRILRPHECLEFVTARAALVFVHRHCNYPITGISVTRLPDYPITRLIERHRTMHGDGSQPAPSACLRRCVLRLTLRTR